MPISEYRISKKTASRLLQSVAVFYTLMNIAVVVLVSINGMEGDEPASYIISHSLGILGGLWLTWYIGKESKKPDSDNQ